MAGRNRASDPEGDRRRRVAGIVRKLLALTLAVVLSFACAGPTLKKVEKPHGVYHRVKKGETLWAISKAYRTDIQDIAEINNITNPASINEDSVVFIPGADQVVDLPPHKEAMAVPKKEEVKPVRKPIKTSVNTVRKKSPAKSTSIQAKAPQENTRTTPAPLPAPVRPEPKKLVFDRSRFIWPMRGTLAAKFGIQPNGLKYNGIRISAREGTPIVASAAGEVIHAAPIKYYGETIIIKHDGHYSTVYTFLKNKKVRIGDRVKKGERIALLSRPDNGNGKPYLNFEIRRNNKPRNPLFFLPEK